MLFLNLLFWAFFASYVVHILDESLLNGGFVRWIADNVWPTYTWRMFFWLTRGPLLRLRPATCSLTVLVVIGSSCR